MRLGHLSDVHVVDLTGVTPQDFIINKRLTGGVNLLFARAARYSVAVFETALHDMVRRGVEHLVVTGDLSNLSFDSEFLRARSILRTFGGGDRVTVIPGNHDAYLKATFDARSFERIFAEFLPQGADTRFPFVKRFGSVVILGVRSAVPTEWLMAYGHVDGQQLLRLRELLLQYGQQRCFRVVLVHHHLHDKGRPWDFIRVLHNSADLVGVLREAGAELLLHGHEHSPTRAVILAPHGPIPVISPGSSNRVHHNPLKRGHYNIYTIEPGRRLQVETFVYDPMRRQFAPVDGTPLA